MKERFSWWLKLIFGVGCPFWALLIMELRGAVVEDLGIISGRRGLSLEACKRRTDFLEFRLEFLPEGQTNPVVVISTNSIIHLGMLTNVPSGPAIMGVESRCTDGSKSAMVLYRVNIQRRGPSAPSASPIGFLVQEQPSSVVESLETVRRELAGPVPPPPLPPGAGLVPKLPGGTNESYQEYRARIEAAQESGLRRNER